MHQIISPVFFFNDTATTEIYTLSLHDALPICNFQRTMYWLLALLLAGAAPFPVPPSRVSDTARTQDGILLRVLAINDLQDRKSTRLNSSHLVISYAVFCLKKKSSSTASTWSCC